MKMVRYRVTGFRSVEDSGWIDADKVTALIGENESGKTNLLLPLWKFNPAREGSIDLVSDSPRKRFAQIRAAEKKPVFVTVELELDDEVLAKVAELTRASADSVRRVLVGRDYDGDYVVEFPDDVPSRLVPTADVLGMLRRLEADVDGADTLKTEAPAVESLRALLRAFVAEFDAAPDAVPDKDVERTHAALTEARGAFTRPTSEV